MQKSSWKKCDLQVATPAWNFTLPAGSTYDFSSPRDRDSFLELYMRELRSKGVDVVALADHNTGEWIDAAKVAGARNGITVFPGCEVTTGSGADGAHLLIIGDLSKTSQDFDRLLESVLGFTGRRRFNEQGQPTPSSKTAEQILDDLSDEFVAIAPHVFGQNGLASGNTVKGDLRWRSLHHPRLSAVDPGNCSNSNSDSYRHRFCRRELADYPCLIDLPFVSTSDAYCLEHLASRFTWIRMGTPSLEALRQAFLDHRTRVICDWDERLAGFPERNPNNIRHAWIEQITLEGTLGNSNRSLIVDLHPNLNVVIGGRGSGKSTLVAALREVYGTTEDLPPRVREDVEAFSRAVFSSAEIHATHRLQESQQIQTATWRQSSGSMTDSAHVATDFPVQIFSQKELFERAAGDKRDPYLGSRSLAALLDQSLHLDRQGISDTSPSRLIERDRQIWMIRAKEHADLVKDLHQLPLLTERAQLLHGQVEAFSSPAVKEKLNWIDATQKRSKHLQRTQREITDVLEQIETISLNDAIASPSIEDDRAPATYIAALVQVQELRKETADALAGIAERVRAAMSSIAASEEMQAWASEELQASEELREYSEGLANQGLSPDAFTALSEDLAQTTDAIERLKERQVGADDVLDMVDRAWAELMRRLAVVRELRKALLDKIREASKQLRFRILLYADQTAWTEAIRELMRVRVDAYVEDVQSFAHWLWEDQNTRDERWKLWRTALAAGDMQPVVDGNRSLRRFLERVGQLDEPTRLFIAAMTPPDAIEMEFLKPGGDPASDGDWQPISEGSPGQRTAAMLAFVLHHGSEPLIIDQPEDDLDSEWITNLVVGALRQSRWSRQLIVVTHNANIPVLGDADQVIALENSHGALRIRSTPDGETERLHVGPVEFDAVRLDIQRIMEGGIDAFLRRERRYNAEVQAARHP